jgi:hypothetical protein
MTPSNQEFGSPANPGRFNIGADDFVRYCRETKANPNFHTLRGIASAKAIGKFN